MHRIPARAWFLLVTLQLFLRPVFAGEDLPAHLDPDAVYFPVAEISAGLEQRCLALADEAGHGARGFAGAGFIQHDLEGRIYRAMPLAGDDPGPDIFCHADLGIGRVAVAATAEFPAEQLEDYPRLPQFEGKRVLAHDSRWAALAQQACAALIYDLFGRPRFPYLQKTEGFEAAILNVAVAVEGPGDLRPVKYCAYDTAAGEAEWVPDPDPELRRIAEDTYLALRPKLVAEGPVLSGLAGVQEEDWRRDFSRAEFRF